MIVSVDAETYYDNEYSLRRMSEVDYVLSPLFETIMVSIKIAHGPVNVYTDDASIRAALNAIDWSKAALLNHNSRFDGSILAWHYGIVPALYLDTLSMARAMTHAHAGTSSLAGLAKYLALPPKGDAVIWAKGKRRDMFSHDELMAYVDYCSHDTELTYEIFNKFMAAGFPKSELKVIDLAVRKFIEPQAMLNHGKLTAQLEYIQNRKTLAFQKVSHIDPSVFSSNVKFAQLLASYDVEIPTKISPTTNQEIPALAKNDWGFKELCADETLPDEVKAILACRIGAKSTIDETRTITLLNLSTQRWTENRGFGWMPVPYKYYGAHTGRFSGDGGYNFANLRREAPVREAIEAPEGYVIVHRDSSQIEARMLAWLADCQELITAFAQGRDIYSEFASRFYQRLVTKADVARRFAGKTAILSLGYGCGWQKFRHALYIGQGGVSLKVTEKEARNLVYFYREAYAEIPKLWMRGEAEIRRMMGKQLPGEGSIWPSVPVIEVDRNCIWLPNDLPIQYPNLRYDLNLVNNAYEGFYDDPYGGRKKLYGAKFIENVTQALARIVVTDIELRVYHATGYRPFMSTYDSHEYLVPRSEVRWFDEFLENQFSMAPPWAPGLPLASEGGWGFNLLDAERGVNP